MKLVESRGLEYELCFESSCREKGGGVGGWVDLQEDPPVLHLIFLRLSIESPSSFISITALVRN